MISESILTTKNVRLRPLQESDLAHFQRWLADDARIYIEMDKDQPELLIPPGWQVLKNKTAGNVRYMLAATDV